MRKYRKNNPPSAQDSAAAPKLPSSSALITSKHSEGEKQKELNALLKFLHQKLSSPVFDGGFDSLLQKISNIEKSHSTVLQKMEDLSNILYEPDRGVFSRIKDVEKVQTEGANNIARKLEVIEEDLEDLRKWKAELESDSGALTNARHDHKSANLAREWGGKIFWSLLLGILSLFGVLIKTIYELTTKAGH